MRRKFDNSDELCAARAKESDTVILSFSAGKDSIACWIKLRQHFKRIIPVYLDLVPGLRFIDRTIERYEKHFQTPILRYPNPKLFSMLNNFLFQPPERCQYIEALDLQEYTYDDIFTDVRRRCDAPQAWTAVGVRQADSLHRRMIAKVHGSANPRRRQFYPVFDWTSDDLEKALRAEGCGLPIDYKWFGSSFDGIDFHYLSKLREVAPEDYRTILEWFPLADLEIYRRHKTCHAKA